MLFLKNDLKKPLFRTILFSYLFLCLLVLAASSMTFMHNYRILEKTLTQNGKQEASLLSSQINTHMTSLLRSMDVLSSSNAVMDLSICSDEEISSKTTEYNRLRREINSFLAAEKCSNLFVWYTASESILSSSTHRYNKDLIPGYLQTQGISEEAFYESIAFKGLYSLDVMPDGSIWVMRSVLDSNYERCAVLIAVVDFNNSFFSSLLSDFSSNNENIYLLYHNGEKLLYSSHELSPELREQLLSLNADSNEQISINGSSYLPIFNNLRTAGLSLQICIPTNNLYNGLHLFVITTVLVLGGAMLLMFILSFLHTRYLYAPVQQLTELLKSNADGEFRETYDNLIDGLHHLKSDYKKMSETQRLDEMKQEFRAIEYYMQGAALEDPTDYKGLLSRVTGIEDGSGWRMAIIHIPSEWKQIFGEDPLEDGITDMRGFLLKNVSEELLSSDYSFRLLPVDQNFVLLSSADESSADDFLARVEMLKDFFQQAMGLNLTIILGPVYTDLSLIPDAYRMLEEELRYSLFWEVNQAENKVLQLPTIRSEQPVTNPASSLEHNRRLLNCLDIEDYEGAYQILDEILRTLPRDRHYLNYSIYRMYGLISMLSIMLDTRSKEDSEFWMNLDYENRLYNVSTMNQLLSLSRELFDRIIENNAQKTPNNEPEWLHQVEMYIQNNYSDINLSVASIADHFHLSVPHLSRTFKSNMDCGLLEYIQRLRVSKARELLEQGVNVSEAAERVGYAETKALRRAFKRYEGINPSDYKKNQL